MAGQPEFNTVEDLFHAIAAGTFQPAILVGAGISSDAGAPLFRQFSEKLVSSALDGLPVGKAEIATVANVLRPEALMSRIVSYLGSGSLQAYQALDCEPDHNHAFLIRAIENGCHVVTPNLDLAIEKASKNGLEPSYSPEHYRAAMQRTEQGLELVPGLWKYHGTLGRNDGFPAATTEDVGESFFKEKEAVIRHILETRPLVVFGYSGRDHFSFQKILATTPSNHLAYWVEFCRDKNTVPSRWNQMDASQVTSQLSKAFSQKALPERIEQSTEAWEEWVDIQKWAALENRSGVLYAKADPSRIIHDLMVTGQRFLPGNTASIDSEHFITIMGAEADRKAALWIHLRRDLGIHVDDAELDLNATAMTSAQVLTYARIYRENKRFDESVQLIDDFLASHPTIPVDQTVDLVLSRTEAARLSADSSPVAVEENLNNLQTEFGENIGKLSARRLAAQQALLRCNNVNTWSDARTLGERNIELAKGNPEHTATAFNTQANVLRGKGAPEDSALLDEALELLSEAIKINHDLWNHHALFQNYRTASIVHQKRFGLQVSEERAEIRAAAIYAAQRCVAHAVLAAGAGKKGEIDTARATLRYAEELGAALAP